ncbi:FAD-dependent oxidoreductase [Sphingobium sp. H39-3-25]|uniref:FAD-dependent oxidoreductase n=1 Tax=Sphingobium arseniciresistens TaxID=3030834 RepID=UPI0023B96AC8|nr:FAD-dependent oxidoreductase [Sphingobium arseniciresistens]
MSQPFDVIVVGAGTAGVPAAVAAAERGLRVALVEAADDIGGTLVLSGGSISGAGTPMQQAAGVEDSPDQHFADALRINHGTGDHVLLRAWIDRAAGTIDWLLAHGWTCTPFEPVFAPEHDLYTTPRTYRSTEQGFSLIAAYRHALAPLVESGAITLMLGTRVRELIVEDGVASGVKATQGEKDIQLEGRAVILTTGGFSGSAEHWQRIHGVNPLRYHIDTVVGDGMDMASAAGGATWYEDTLLPSFGGTRNLGAPASAWMHSVINPLVRPPWEIYVNSDGDRFMPEDEGIIDARERAIMRQPGWSFWVIYDEAARRDSPPLFKWEPDQLEALFAGEDEDYVRADSIEEMAQRCGLPVERLKATVDLYNRGQAVGSDMWRRKHLPSPIAQGPFHAVRHYGFSICCYPGIRVDHDLRVVGKNGAPIEGLYAAGEAIGIGFLGHGFLSGGIVGSAVTFGLKLGREVLA